MEKPNKYNNKIFRDGVTSVLKVLWALKCVTPLAVRNGQAIAYTEQRQNKARNQNVNFLWRKKLSESEAESACVCFGYEIINQQVTPYHFIPATSIRGALRSWTMRHFVRPEVRQQLSPPEKGDQKAQEKHLENLRNALDDEKSGFQLVANLFGVAMETREKAQDRSHRSRLRVETEKFTNSQARSISVSGETYSGAGPDNVHRQMSVRNPLDRMTHAARREGLHHFLEFCAGESFKVYMTIANPVNIDLALLSLWVREINEGLLRFGALANIGRGRVQIVDQSYTLWTSAKTKARIDVEKLISLKTEETDEILTKIWQKYTIPSEKLQEFEQYL